MRHLFIVNPTASKVRKNVDGHVKQIRDFMDQTGFSYEVHVTRWARDAVGYVRRFVSAAEGMVRVHSYGGSGTLYEVVNGIIGLPNTEVAAYSLGRSNEFLQYFGREKLPLFRDLNYQVNSPAISVDAISDGVNYGIANCLTGIEAEAYIAGSRFGESIHLTADFWPLWFAALKIFKQKRIGRHYEVTIDGISYDGDYASIMVANTPCYQRKLNPAVDAHPTDGGLDIYLVKAMNRLPFLRAIPTYTAGHYRKMPECFTHHTCKRIRIQSDDTMLTTFDGEKLISQKLKCSLVPGAIQVVLPTGIRLEDIPEIYRG